MSKTDKMDRFRQLEGPRRSPAPAATRSNAASRFDAVLGPGEKAPAVPEPPPISETTVEAAPPMAADGGQAQQPAQQAAWEAAVVAELNRRPMHAGQQIALWRALMKRGSQEIDESCRMRISLPVGIALVGGLFFLGSLLVTGPRLWHLFLLLGAGLFFLRRKLK
jgi:hypothetical protein